MIDARYQSFLLLDLLLSDRRFYKRIMSSQNMMFALLLGYKMDTATVFDL